MISTFKIDLQVDYPGKPDRYYSLRLKNELSNEPAEFSPPKRMFVMSGMEGDFHAFCQFLLKRKIMNKYLQWTFDEGHLVILGDRFEDGQQAVECLWLIYALEEQARRQGGYVHFILSNHTILQGEWRSTHPKYADKKIDNKNPITALYNGNSELWNWLCTKNMMEKIGPLLFVHGGIPPILNDCPYSLAEINKLARAHGTSATQSFTDPVQAQLFSEENNPFFWEGYYNGGISNEEVDATLTRFGVSTIITGLFLKSATVPPFEDKIINVNMDPDSGGLEGLFVRRKRIYRITKEGKKERLK